MELPMMCWQLKQRKSHGLAEGERAADARAEGRDGALAAAERAAGADAVAAAAAAGDGAARHDEQSAELQGGDLQVLGQELVPASQALALRTPDGKQRGQEKSSGHAVLSQDQPRSSQARSSEKRQDVAVAMSPAPNGHGGGDKVVTGGHGSDANGAMETPQGPPMSFPPASFVTPEGQVQNILPLISPEQSARLHEIHRSSPMLAVPQNWSTPQGDDLGRGGGVPSGGQGGQSMLANLLQAFGQVPNDYVESRQRDHLWKLQVEQGMQQLGVQLRASQTENQRLREELKHALERKESSSATPEEINSAALKEDGTRVQQASVREEDGTRVRQSSVREEDGTRVQQASVREEDGARVQQASVREEDGTRVQQASVREEDGTRVQQDQGREEDGARAQQ
eukprot:s3094_g9.t1